MSISQGLLSLASKLKEQADDLLAQAEYSPALLNYTLEVVAKALYDLELGANLIDGKEPSVTLEMMETIAGLAEALDETDDEVLLKRASLLDELLVTISAPKSSMAIAAKASEDEINALREKYHSEQGDKLYNGIRGILNEPTKNVSKAVKDQVKEYRPLEAPLMTRYCPDHNGSSMMRIADRVYQCPLDRKVYNYESGFTTEKGNKIPGGGVENQVPDFGHRYIGHTVFDSRQSSLNRFAQAAPKYSVVVHSGGALDITIPDGTTDGQKKKIQQEIAATYGQKSIFWHNANDSFKQSVQDRGFAADGLPKHTVSLPTGSHELVITVPPGTTEAQKVMIKQNIVNTYGTQYTIKWNELSAEAGFSEEDALKKSNEFYGSGVSDEPMTAHEISLDLTDEELDGLRYIAGRYDSGDIIYKNYNSETGKIPVHAILDAFKATKGDGGNLGTVPLAGGSLGEKIMKAFDEVDAWEYMDHYIDHEAEGFAKPDSTHGSQEDESFEDEDISKIEAMADLFSKFAGDDRCNCENSACEKQEHFPHKPGACKNKAHKQNKIQDLGQVCNSCYKKYPEKYKNPRGY